MAAVERPGHRPWCVREHKTAACSSKRGRWDRTTNTWDSDLTDADREVIREALRRRAKGRDAQSVAEYVRRHPTFANAGWRTVVVWGATQKKLAGEGREWP